MPAKSQSKRPSKAKRKPKAKRSSARATRQRESTQRLQRLLASAGLGSRRQCEELIQAGRVEVDGQVVTKLGTTVDPETNKVHVDGTLLKPKKLVYFAVNKPIGVVTTNRDPQGRPRVVDLVPPDDRIFPVGRLDRNSEGLILLTNDGDLSQRLTHPKFGVRKIYRVTVAGKVDAETMNQMRRGIYIAEGQVRVEGARLLKSRSRSTELEIVLREGKNREIRRILARLGHKVQHLRRIAVGPLRLGDLPLGAYRIVTAKEVEKLWLATEAETDTAGRSPRSTKRGSQRGSKRTKSGARKKSARRPPSSAESNEEFSLGGSARAGSVIGGEAGEQTGETVRRGKSNRKKSAGRRSTKKTVRSRTKSAAGGRKGKAKVAAKKSTGKRGSRKSATSRQHSKPAAKRRKSGKRKRKG